MSKPGSRDRDPSWGATPGTVLLRLLEARIGVTRSVIYQRCYSDRSRGDLEAKIQGRAARLQRLYHFEDGGVAAGVA